MLPRDLEQAVVHGHIEHVVLEDVQVLCGSGNLACMMLPRHIDRRLLILLVDQGTVPRLIMRGDAVPAIIPHPVVVTCILQTLGKSQS